MGTKFVKTYATPEELQQKVEEYFDKTTDERQTRAGLALHLGISTMTLLRWQKGNDEDVADIINLAITRIENGLETNLRNCRGNPAGTIFALKNVAGWRNNNDVEVKGSGTFKIISSIPRPEEE